MSETSRKPQIYAIDFDGTIAKTKWPDIIGPNRPVVDFIKRLHARGDQWILWTNRDGENLDMALDWCREQGIVPDAVNDNLPHMKEFFGNNPRKVFANFYIDDHNAGGIMLPADDDVAPGAGQEKGEDPSNRTVRRFTPGPWFCTCIGHIKECMGDPPKTIAVIPGVASEAKMSGITEAKANAALVAAAPKMLAKLEEVRKYLPKIVRDSVDKLIAEATMEDQ